MTKKKEQLLTPEQERIAEEIFRVVYNWGKEGIKTDHQAPFYRELIRKLVVDMTYY